MTSYSLEEVKKRLAEKILEEGGSFFKCANCGGTYPVMEDWASTTVCSPLCDSEYVAYLNQPNQFN
jgi:hypothetical protein